MFKFNDYLKIGPAARFIGVTPNTLRNWEKQKKIETYRCPHSSYRLYKKEDLEALLNNIKPVLQYTERQQMEINKKLALLKDINLKIHDLFLLAFAEAIFYPTTNKYHPKYISNVFSSDDCEDGELFGKMFDLQPQLLKLMDEADKDLSHKDDLFPKFTNEFIYAASQLLNEHKIRVSQEIITSGIFGLVIRTELKDEDSAYWYKYHLDTSYHEDHHEKCGCDLPY